MKLIIMQPSAAATKFSCN